MKQPLGKYLKDYQFGKVRMGVFENRTKKGVKYNIFTLFNYSPFNKAKYLVFNKQNIVCLKKILAKIEIKLDDEEEKD